MAENPVVTLARLLGGVVLMRGRLGHQVLGQLLVMGTNEVAVAGAAVVVAASTRYPNAVAQVALRTAAPALAVRAILRKQEGRLDRKQALLDERERRLAKREQERDDENRELRDELERLSTRLRSFEAATPAAGAPAPVSPPPSTAPV